MFPVYSQIKNKEIKKTKKTMTYFFEFIAWILYYHDPPVFTATGNSRHFATFPVVSLRNAEIAC